MRNGKRRGPWERLAVNSHTSAPVQDASVFVCLRANRRMWYLVCVRVRPQRRSMLTRRAAGPPDVPVPTRLVASGPLLLSLPCTRMHIHTQMHVGTTQRTSSEGYT